MRLVDLLIKIINEDYNPEHYSVGSTRISSKIPSIREALEPHGFNRCVEFRLGDNRRIWINNSGLIAYWEYERNSNIPIIIDVNDLDESYLVLKYGKVILEKLLE